MRSLKRAAMVAALTASALAGTTGVASAVSVNASNGSTNTGVSGNVSFAGWVNPTCSSSTLTASLTDNTTSDGDAIEARITNSAWAGCSLTTTGNHGAGKWILTTSGAADSHGADYSGSVNSVDVTIGSCRFTGNLTDGGSSHVGYENSGVTGTSDIQLSSAGTLSGFCGSGTITGTWSLATDWDIS